MEGREAHIDIDRLTKPEADAYRYIAKSLGVRFAGDMVPQIDDAAIAAPRAGSTLDVAPADPRAATLLDRIPVAILVVTRDSLAFMNRAAIALFGYSSCNILEAAGGLGTLFDGSEPGADGVMLMSTAKGTSFRAKVTMATTDWSLGRAMMITVQPTGETFGAVPNAPAQPLGAFAALLDANPDPIALVEPNGTIAVANAAFRRLAPDARSLPDGLTPADHGLALNLMELAFCLPEDGASSTQRVHLDGAAYRMTAGALTDEGLCCLVFHRIATGEPAPAAPSPFAAIAANADDEPADATADAVPAKPGSPLEQAVREVRRLVKDAAILLINEDDAPITEPSQPELEAHLLRLVLLSVAARATGGSVITARRHPGSIVIECSEASLFEAVLQSGRIRALADLACVNLSLTENGPLTVLPRRPSGEVVPLFDRAR
ncbi:PAS domain-containing protein [Acuticoccus sp. M5D2P5]|uniref:PAS domain-containing protein n=1 Tax=Acuticoccus kalidii TaxID=2910977 RepID=UPI001F4582E4|nr:PAS domain-containing protein [Acuticoccus kalidii]MCF3936010.1 PAS domain-containing protein [Acuticoccus kalidii]